MSKKNKHLNLAHNTGSNTGHSNIWQTHAHEYEIIKKDLTRLLLLNMAYLAALLVVYRTNANSHYLENWYHKLIG